MLHWAMPSLNAIYYKKRLLDFIQRDLKHTSFKENLFDFTSTSTETMWYSEFDFEEESLPR